MVRLYLSIQKIRIKNFLQSIDNLKNTNQLNCDGANVYDIMNHDKLYITETAFFDSLEKRLADAK